MRPSVEQIVNEANKIEKIISSCKTIPQLKGALSVVELWEKKYYYWIHVAHNSGFAYRLGKMTGLMIGKRDEILNNARI